MRKEPLKKYIDRFMGDKKMNEEFPRNDQRFAVALSYARKFYSDKAVTRLTHLEAIPAKTHTLQYQKQRHFTKSSIKNQLRM